MSTRQIRKIGIIMNGVTGRIGTTQHLMQAIVPIIQQGGVPINETTAIVPDPILIGRSPDKLERLAELTGITKCSTNLDQALADKQYTVYFDAQTPPHRPVAIKKAIEAGKHVYCEKPSALTTQEAYDLYTTAHMAGVKHGVVQDKLFSPGLIKLQRLLKQKLLGDVLTVKMEFGYWVFDGQTQASQRPSWNYRKEDGGGIALDLLCHGRYILETLFGSVKSVSCAVGTMIKRRWNEVGKPYVCTADDTALCTCEIEGGILAQLNLSWATRVRRDDIFTLQVDGTLASAVADVFDCRIQTDATTPKPAWNPTSPSPVDFYADWARMPDNETFANPYRAQWELFLRHVATDEPFGWTLLDAARGVQMAEKALESSHKRTWMDLLELKA